MRARWLADGAALTVFTLTVRAAPLHAQQGSDTTAFRALTTLLGQDSTKRNAIADLLRPTDYAVPSSPAFELLPDKPSDVVHLVSAHDFQSNVSSWFDGTKLRAGISVDARPLVRSGGSLPQYQKSWVRRLGFRTVLSAGTAAATSGSSDVIGAVGLRLPLIDHSDPRTDKAFLEASANAYNAALEALKQPLFGAPQAQLKARRDTAAANLDSLRAKRAALVWNAMRLDLGFAGSATALNGTTTRRDSVRATGGGAWLGFGLPLGPMSQLTIAGKARWSRAATDSQETRRTSAGARALFFLTPELALSAEGSYVWSTHSRLASLDDTFTHLGLVGEWYVPELHGWIGAGYGGDAQRSKKIDNQFSVHYALYVDRLLNTH